MSSEKKIVDGMVCKSMGQGFIYFIGDHDEVFSGMIKDLVGKRVRVTVEVLE